MSAARVVAIPIAHGTCGAPSGSGRGTGRCGARGEASKRRKGRGSFERRVPYGVDGSRARSGRAPKATQGAERARQARTKGGDGETPRRVAFEDQEVCARSTRAEWPARDRAGPSTRAASRRFVVGRRRATPAALDPRPGPVTRNRNRNPLDTPLQPAGAALARLRPFCRFRASLALSSRAALRLAPRASPPSWRLTPRKGAASERARAVTYRASGRVDVFVVRSLGALASARSRPS